MTAEQGVWTSFTAAFRLERGGLRPAAAAKATAGVIVPLIAGVAWHDPAAGATAAFGALSVGIALITAGPRAPVRTMLAASLGMGAATFAGCVTGLIPAIHLMVLAAAGFAAGLLVAAGRGATQVGVNATIALLVFGRFAADPATAAVHMSWVLAGGLLQTALGIAARSPRPLRPQRDALAAGYEALAGAAASGQVPFAAAEAAVTARDTIGAWLLADDRPQAGPLRGLTDELDRIRQELHALFFQRAAPGEARRVDDALTTLAGALSEIAASLRHGRAAVGTEPAASRLLELSDQLTSDASQPASPAARFSAARIAALAGQVRAVDRMVTQLAGVRRITLPVAAARAAEISTAAARAAEVSTAAGAIVVLPSGLLSALRQVRAAANPSSPAFRHAVRLAVVIPAASELSRLLPWQRGYWLPAAALIVLRPDFAATVSRGVARTVGTAAGAAAGAVIVATLHPAGAALVGLIAAATWLGYTVFAASYALYAVFLTALVILLVSAAQASTLATVENRGFDTLIGGTIAIAAYLIWPTWEARALQAATADRFGAIRRYLHAVLHEYVEPGGTDTRAAMAKLAAATRRAQSSVLASLGRARGEPARTRPDIDRFAGVLAAGRRILAGTHALASHLQDARRQVAVPDAAVIAGQLDEAMAAIESAIRSGQPPGPLPGLRDSHRQLTAASAPGQTPAQRRGAILAALLDPLVDAIDTAADLLDGGIGRSGNVSRHARL